MPRPDDGLIEVWQRPDGQWRWAWRSTQGEGAGELVSHRAFDSRDEAVSSAEESYPGLPVPRPAPTVRPRRRWPWWALAAVAYLLARRRAS